MVNWKFIKVHLVVTAPIFNGHFDWFSLIKETLRVGAGIWNVHNIARFELNIRAENRIAIKLEIDELIVNVSKRVEHRVMLEF